MNSDLPYDDTYLPIPFGWLQHEMRRIRKARRDGVRPKALALSEWEKIDKIFAKDTASRWHAWHEATRRTHE